MSGRNQEMLLSLLGELNTLNVNTIDFCICSMAFDGIEGNSPAAGAILDTLSILKMEKMKINPSRFLLNNDSYNFFKKMGDGIEIGHTNTNINDVIAMIFQKKLDTDEIS